MKSGKAVAIISLTLLMLTWGSAFVVSKSIVERIPPIFFALIRHILASVIMLSVVGLRRSRGIRREAPGWGIVTLMGLTSITFYYIFYNLGLYYTTASQGALIQSSTPAITAALAVVVLHERVTRKRFAGLALSIIGVLLVVGSAIPSGEARNPLWGTLLMCGTVIAWSIYTIAAKRAANSDQLLLATMSTTIGTILLIPPAIWEGWGKPLPHVAGREWLAIGYLAAVVSAGGYLIYNRALRELDAHQVINFTNLVPIIAVIAAVVFLGESIVPLQVVGGTVVLIGVWLAS
ncbi:MAG: DMT family transporter [Gemmatimonadota bacterium]